MPVILNDNGVDARYRIEVDKDNGQVLVTEGTAKTVEVVGQPNQTLFLRNSDDLKQRLEGEGNVSAEVAVDDDPEPVEPVRQRVPLKAGVNPYVDANEVYIGQGFDIEDDVPGGADGYEIENINSGVTIFSLIGDGRLHLSEDERLKLAIRLLSVEPYSIRLPDETGVRFKAEDDADRSGGKAIGSAIFQLHSVLEQRKHEAEVAEWEKEHEAWKARQQDTDEAKALHELVYRRMLEVYENDTAKIGEAESAGVLESRYSGVYANYRAVILSELNDAGTTATIRLEVLKAEEVAKDVEDYALDAIAYKSLADDKGWSFVGGDLNEVKRRYDWSFPQELDKSKKLLDALGVTAVKYVEAHGIDYPAK
ncbi:hypothetical protein AUR04nite_00850 [Glutamicibacter uratoxydans]|uniref:Uncharacterized protein n=1 Tax=Glutamicibacter uratoxydans TaxID=43667 RepID=A0A4Y4DJ31_GLUUR|nr:hypothetical protein [Glutamicibacter uratoxydans]GED04553.1 hypothetical protein AUR04nite_00850 [Glutamicibacter uratoxydans]